jgi:hypothetical protein
MADADLATPVNGDPYAAPPDAAAQPLPPPVPPNILGGGPPRPVYGDPVAPPPTAAAPSAAPQPVNGDPFEGAPELRGASLTAFTPTMRQAAAQRMMGDERAAVGGREKLVNLIYGTTGLTEPGMSLSDLTPAGQAFGVEEALRRGDVKGAAMAALPLGGMASRELMGLERAAVRKLGELAPAAAREVSTAAEAAAAKEAPALAAEAPAAAAPPAPITDVPLLKQDEPFGAHNPVGTHPHEEALTVNDIMHPDTPAPFAPRSRDVETIAAELDNRGQGALKQLGVKSGRIAGPDPVTDELLARSYASEVNAALDRPGANAADWYTNKIKEAMDVAAVMHPEIATDPAARDAFRAALAITSQGETVQRNAELALPAYRVWQATGRFPEDVVAKNGPAMNNNFAKLNRIMDDRGGWDETRAFLDKPTTVRQLKEDGFDVGSSEAADTQVYGSHVLGAKIGNGFYQNLGGNYDPTTFDLWWMRGWNRKTGNLSGLQDISNQRARLENALAAEGQKVPRTANGLDNIADATVAQHERDYRNFRPEYDSGARKKSELTYASERWQKARSGINEQPSGPGQRTWMRSVVDRARNILSDQGRPMTNADLQAIVWYPEKDLYAKLGSRPSEGVNVDYATALRNIARKQGFTDEQLAAAGTSPVLPAHRGPGPASPDNVGGGNAGSGTQVGAAPGPGAGPGPAATQGPQVGTPADGDPFATPPGLVVPVSPTRRRR